ncbi:hypothetical protein VNO77_04118 [Canavalia gladiata]|uniref:Uncharacterized protein n=1 Tax=Canavalia gladiata TaxID=3824 RepID=A0AAN9MY13_CANGL
MGNLVFEIYGHILSLVVKNDMMRTMQPKKGLRTTECEVEVVFATGGLSDPKPGIVPEAVLLEFNTELPVPKDDEVVGGAVGINGVGGCGVTGVGGCGVELDCVGGVGMMETKTKFWFSIFLDNKDMVK